ncbi:MAG: T9SS type A sorting domain-containing protein [Candidatus Cloacimonetes bacterium]|nr:T9SS type A sorting domain-containing protein [Candidatus Cloacimonadota bacterium]
MKKILLALLIIVPYLLNAQWSNDPAENTAICDLTGSQAIPKIATSSTGYSYISWFSNETGNYDVRLQKFNVIGNELWEHNGILISDHTSMSWLTNWDMTIDGENHAILTFQDIRNQGNNNIYAYRISPEGDFIWGDDGLELSNSPSFDVSPKVTVTSAGNAVIAWQSEDIIILQKISPEGNLLWGDNGITLSCANTYSWPQLIPVGEDGIILKYFEDTGPPYSPTRHVYAQRFNVDGEPVWTESTVISNAGGISAWTQIFPIVSDGNDGFFIAWHDDRDSNMLASIFIQHVDADGQTLFIDNGLEVSLMPNRNHFYPEIAFPSSSNEVYVYWNEMDGGQNQRGIYGQKISETGERLWTDNGMVFIELSSTDVNPIATRSSESDVVVFYEESPSAVNNHIKAMRIDEDGAFVWVEEYITLSSVVSEKLHSVVNHFNYNQWISVWEDRRNDDGDIYAQNVNLNGTLGSGYPVGLISFEAEYIDGNVIIYWVTQFETNNMGWNLYRSETANFEDAIQINSELIPGAGTTQQITNYQFVDEYEFIPGQIYYYWLECVSTSGDTTIWGPISITIPQAGTDDHQLTIVDLQLSNYPNPFNPTTTISFNVTQSAVSGSDGSSFVTLDVYNIKGQKVKQLINNLLTVGQHSVIWDGSDENNQPVSSGIYFYKLNIDGKTKAVKKMMLMK